MKKIFILPTNTDLNRGDQALVWESIRLVQDLYSKEDVEICLIESGVSEAERDAQSSQTKKMGYHFFQPILEHPSRYFVKESHEKVGISKSRLLKWGAVAFSDYARTRPLLYRTPLVYNLAKALLSSSKRSTLKALQESDAVFVKGGGFIHAYGKISDGYQMYFSLYMILLAIRLGKPVYILPNSFGPLRDKYARRLATRMLKRCAFISSREKVSYDFLKSLAIDNYQSPDLGYYLTAPIGHDASPLLSDYVKTTRKILGMTVRPWRFPTAASPTKAYTHYIEELATFIQTVTGKDWHVVLFAHTLGPSAHEDDRIAIRDVQNRLTENKKHVSVIEDQNLDCIDMMSLYKGCHCFIGTRFHSVIFSQNQLVPTIAISYGGNKGTGIMTDLGLQQYVVPIDEVSSARLLFMLEQIEIDRNKVIQHLRDFKERSNLKRKELIDELRQRI